MAFVLKTFGRLQLVDGEGNAVAFPEKGLLLLAYLFTTDQASADRTTLARFLWGEADRDVALSTLRKVISRIKARQNDLGVNILSSQGNMLTLDRGALSSDMLLADKEEEEVEPFSRLRQLVTLMNQPFLEPVHNHSRQFQRWLAERENFHNELLAHTLRTASQLAPSQKESELLRKAAVILFRTEPKDPETLQLLIRIFKAEGEVESLRSYFEQRRSSTARAVAAGSGSDEGDAKSLRPPSVSSKAKLEAALPLEPEDIRIAIPRLVLLPPEINPFGRKPAFWPRLWWRISRSDFASSTVWRSSPRIRRCKSATRWRRRRPSLNGIASTISSTPGSAIWARK